MNKPQIEWEGVAYRKHLGAGDTNGSIGIFESTDAPGAGPPRHIHHDADETFFVLSGEVEFLLNGVRVYRTVGETVFVPRGHEHCFRVVGEQPARMLTIMTPGGFEGFFDAVAKEGLRLPEDLTRAAEIGRAFHLEFTGPPLGGE